AHDRRASAADRVHDLARGGVDHLVVVRLEPDADLLSRHGVLSLFSSGMNAAPPGTRGRACRPPQGVKAQPAAAEIRLRLRRFPSCDARSMLCIVRILGTGLIR